MKTAASGKRGGHYYGLGTYLGLAGALLGMIVLFSLLSSHFLSYDTFSTCLLYTSPSPRDKRQSRMPSSA